ncbi:MAG: hypothetical protein QGD93_10965 [Actinomycetota bacterium]|nr:hypothetical protein [Actinomycetota bacterium]
MRDDFTQTLERSAPSFMRLPGAEYVDYIPASGPQRRILAVISRTPPEWLARTAGSVRPSCEVLVHNSSADGISSSEVDTGGDKIDLGYNVNEMPRILRIAEIINHDAGMMELRAV